MKKVLSILAMVVVMLATAFTFSGCGEITNEDILKVLPNARGSFEEITYDIDSIKPLGFEKAYKLKDGTLVVKSTASTTVLYDVTRSGSNPNYVYTPVNKTIDLTIISAQKHQKYIAFNVEIAPIEDASPEKMAAVLEPFKAGLNKLIGAKVEPIAASANAMIETEISSDVLDSGTTVDPLFSLNLVNSINCGYSVYLYSQIKNIKIDINFTAINIDSSIIPTSDGTAKILSYVKDASKEYIVAEGNGAGNRGQTLVYVTMKNGAIESTKAMSFYVTGRMNVDYNLSHDEIMALLDDYNNIGQTGEYISGATRSSNSVRIAVKAAVEYVASI